MSLTLAGRAGRGLLPLALILTAGCGDDEDDAASTEGEAVTSETLDGRTFVSTEVTGETLVEGSEIRMTFDGDQLSVNAGCNELGGGYTIEDGTLTAGPFRSTQMACEDALQQQDEWLTALLEGGPTVTLADDVLTISSDTTTVVLDES